MRYLTPNVPLPFQVAQIVGPGSAFIGRDATYWLSTTADRLLIGKCLTDVLKVGVLDSRSTGCIISDVVLWVSLAVILGVVLIRFLLALVFGWCISWKLGSIREETAEERRQRQDAVLQWEMNNVEQMHYPRHRHRSSISSVDDPQLTEAASALPSVQHAPAESHFPTYMGNGSGLHNNSSGSFSTASRSNNPGMTPNANRRRRFFPTTSRFTQPSSPNTMHLRSPALPRGGGFSTSNSPHLSRRTANSSLSPLPYTISSQFFQSMQSTGALETEENVNAQAQKQYNFNFDLIHTFMVVTCYSEGEEGLRTTLDSLANTDYPASHKMLLVICDGIITGSGNSMSTPDTVLSMMKDDLVPRDQVKPSSYVAIADGSRRHNMAKVYAGFYKYNDDPEKAPAPKPLEEQQRVPMIVIVKCGTPLEASTKKPGNRGKRDSQVILMNAMQKIYYCERMCELEYQFSKAVVKLSGHHPSRFETCLMVRGSSLSLYLCLFSLYNRWTQIPRYIRIH